MSDLVKNMDPAFQGLVQRIGIDIWRIENSRPVLLPKSDYGKFYSGDSYIILKSTTGRGGVYQHDIHFWIGKDTSQDDAKSSSIKAVELDTILGGHAIHHQEIQGFESDMFLSYFKPCFIPLVGGHTSGAEDVGEENFETRLYVSKGKRVVRLKQVPFARSSLNHDDIFILDTEKKIFQFNGANSNIQERAKALDVIQYLMDKYHNGKCDVSVIDDGKLAAESDSGDFWVIFGGFAPISRRIATEDDDVLETSPGKLYSIIDGQVKNCKEGALSKTMLENNKCYLLECGAEVFVWVGKLTHVEERKATGQAAETFVKNQNRPKSTHIIRVSQGYETRLFKSNFDTWPTSTVISGGDEGRGKVAALLKKKGDVKGAKTTPLNEEIISLLAKGGKLEVWSIDDNSKIVVPDEEIGKFYSGGCYIVLYTYHSNERKEDYFLSFWIGKDSTLDDQATAFKLSDIMHNSLKGRPVLGRIFQGKEPPQFTALFPIIVILKGGNSSGYKKSIAEKNTEDPTYASDRVALIEISNTSVDSNKAVQVDTVATSLNSNNCFLLHSGSSVFIWNGISSTPEQHQLAAKVAEFLKPGVHLKHAKEGVEISSFWFPLGGKQTYSSKKAVQDTAKYPHLFTFSMNKGKLQVSEVFNFSQDDLLTEDTLILDTHSEVFIWFGHSVDNKEKKCAFDIGQEYINLAVSLDGLSPHVPLYKITEGNEPCFFTSYFSWDNRKAAVLFGDSFAKKMSLLFGTTDDHHRSESNDGGPTQRASALAALSSAFNPSSSSSSKTGSTKKAGQGSQRAAAVAALSNVLTQEQKRASEEFSPPPGEAIKCEDPPEQVVEEDTTCAPENDDSNQVEPKQDTTTSDTGEIVFYSYEQLMVKSTDPVEGINYKEREVHLSDTEFEQVLGMTKLEFYAQPKWKQDMQKKKVDLF